MVNVKEFIEIYNKNFFKAITTINLTFIEELKNSIDEARKNDRQVFLIGNGGSAASSSHWVCDFSKNITTAKDRQLHIQSLVDNIPLGTALSNDISFEKIFSEQLKNYMNPNDIVIALSVSGNSPNLLKGVQYAKLNGAKVFSIIGNFDGEMKDYSDYYEVIQSKNYGVVEDAHMYFCHIISQILKEEAETRARKS